MNRRIACLALLCAAAWPAVSHASMGSIPYLYGFGARGAAMGETFTALSGDASTAFFNPAAMAALPQSQLALSYLYGQPEFRGGPPGGVRKFERPNHAIEINVAQKLNSLTKSGWDIAFGVNLVLDDNGEAFIRFDDLQNSHGSFYRYGPSSFVLSETLGWKIQSWMYMGGGALTTLHCTSTTIFRTGMSGHTSSANIALDANVAFAPIGSLFFRTDPVDIGVAYHGMTYGVNGPITVSTMVLIGSAKLVTLPNVLKYKDTYLPQRLSLGAFWRIAPWVRATIDGVWWNWGGFNRVARTNDQPRQRTGIDFHDTYVPHAGFEFTPVTGFDIRAGYGFEQTPVSQGGSSSNMFLDNSKHIVGFGLGYSPQLRGMQRPLSIDVAYIGQYLVKRNMTSIDDVKYVSYGALNGVIGTLTLRY